MRYILIAAAAGLALSTAAHVATFCTARFGDHASAVYVALFFGAFAVVAAAVEAGKHRTAGVTKSKVRSGDGPIIPESTPRWLRLWLVTLGVYLVVCFASSVYFAGPRGGGGVPTRKSDGSLVLQDRGRIIRPLAPEEFERIVNFDLRWNSGFFMLVYSFCLIHVLALCRAQKQPSGAVDDPTLD